MPLDIVYGDTRNKPIAAALTDVLAGAIENGTVFLGYPVLATSDSRVQVDALLVSKDHGLIAFQFAGSRPVDAGDWAGLIAAQDQLYAVLDAHLSRHDPLRSGRGLAFKVETVTVFGSPVDQIPENVADGHYCDLFALPELIASFAEVSTEIYHGLLAALERVSTIKPVKKRTAAVTEGSRGAVMRQIEKGIANLDRWQKKAAIESPDGPQRIRGLAGSGKTIVLALKAAYWHAQHPDWTIVVTYYSRSLHQQLEGLMTRFSFEHSYEAPDFERLRIMHAWGGSGRVGVYNTIARAIGVTPRDFSYASATYGMDDAFRGICAELLSIALQGDHIPIFDAVLIDEAQDLPPEFFRLVYLFTKDPKRIVWGFDELQRLSEAAMPSTEELFGRTVDGELLVNLEEREGEARRDIVLEVCYRNTPWTLATAHALGFGIYREGGLVQHFDDIPLWGQIGYEPVRGYLESGEHVTLRRSSSSYPRYFDELITPDDAVQLRSFEDESAQDAWIAEQISLNVTRDELEPDDILIVIPNTYTAKPRAQKLSIALARKGIASHHVGVTSSVDEFFRSDSVAMAHIYRAKGNEAPMVYVVDAQFAVQGRSLVYARNILFTAMTRSRAWVRLCGHGSAMAIVEEEVRRVREHDYQLSFKLPTREELAHIRRIHRDRGPETEQTIEKAATSLTSVLALIERGELVIDELPADVRDRIRREFANGN